MILILEGDSRRRYSRRLLLITRKSYRSTLNFVHSFDYLCVCMVYIFSDVRVSVESDATRVDV